MTIEQLITLLAGIGTVVSAGVAFWAVLQMKKQRELSYLPDLVISRMFFDGRLFHDVKSYFANGWTPSTFPKIEGDEEFVFYLPLRNVGLGTAKNISVAWSFPIEKIVCQLNDLGQKILPSAHFSFEDGEITIQSESLGNQGLNSWFNQQKTSLEYLLPVTVKSEPVKLEFPILFTQLCSYLFFFMKRITIQTQCGIFLLSEHTLNITISAANYTKPTLISRFGYAKQKEKAGSLAAS